ncbi:toxin-antitoxin system YwqK family antitoxin [Streptomyces galbus]|nr:hypothetical protein [Streptomyces galbus]GHD55145.1 hypothetical protein GCM10010335_70350 [Streptomyces galbus]
MARTTTRVDIDDPEVDMDMAMRLLYRGQLFTGEVEEYLLGVRVSLETYADGLLHGPSRGWYRDGMLRYEMVAINGRAVGLSREWHPNGALASERVFSEEGGRLLAHREWDEDGVPTRAWHADGGSRRGVVELG